MRGSQQIRILVVDDESDNAELFKALLIKEGYLVTTLLDPTKVIPTLKEGNFHLVLLDMMMPKLSGTEVLEQIRELDDDVAVIVATGFPTVETAVASLKLSASDYVKKPVDPAVFIETVKRVLEKKGITRDPEAELHRSIGRFIREGRTRQNLTLKQLARRTGLSVSLLSQIERAESSASISSLYRIASALRVRMSELFSDV
ncbi:MAG: two-component system response regulator [Archangium gephyra]|uniref:Two-component system response regulator n=1 Tax=Archangium gephyra TaxID=48 RepID=A0A2W5UJB8_9BACT|nr:MAG: two-component system response regulator [Archangium gephyra]